VSIDALEPAMSDDAIAEEANVIDDAMSAVTIAV
jgi:hypothetical protein